MRQVLPSVGEQEQSLAFSVETADMKTERSRSATRSPTVRPPRVRHRAQHAPWLVQRQILESRPGPRCACRQPGSRPSAVDSRRRVGSTSAPSTSNPPCAHQDFTRAPRAKAPRRARTFCRTHTFVRHVSPSNLRVRRFRGRSTSGSSGARDGSSSSDRRPIFSRNSSVVRYKPTPGVRVRADFGDQSASNQRSERRHRRWTPRIAEMRARVMGCPIRNDSKVSSAAWVSRTPLPVHQEGLDPASELRADCTAARRRRSRAARSHFLAHRAPWPARTGRPRSRARSGAAQPRGQFTVTGASEMNKNRFPQPRNRVSGIAQIRPTRVGRNGQCRPV